MFAPTRCYCVLYLPSEGVRPFDDIKRVAKKIQGKLPVIGLLSLLTSAEGGFTGDFLAYPEFSRLVYEKAPENFGAVCVDLERKHGRPANRRYLIYCCWMALYAAGIAKTIDLLKSARRLRVTDDLEIEMDRVVQYREEVMKKYEFLGEQLTVDLQTQLEVAVDALCLCAMGLEDALEVPADDAAMLTVVIKSTFPDAPDEAIAAAFETRTQRTP
ncbi:unnamed protein product [Pedinophyceae sp. YPF-701]|nr:unnamed protein product [Pedinophyceae sp. YPF-701]